MKKFGIILATSAIALAPLVTFAVPPTLPPKPSIPTAAGPIQNVVGVNLFVKGILVWVSAIFWIVAILFIIYAAFLYLTAAGDETKVEKASHTLLYAVIAIVVALIAYGLPFLVNSFLKLTPTS